MGRFKKCNEQDWEVLVHVTTLRAGYEGTRYNYHAIDNKGSWTHIRLNIYPDGGIARLRLYGEARPNWKDVSPHKVRTRSKSAVLYCLQQFIVQNVCIIMSAFLALLRC
jgi:allantoicase